MYVFHVGIRRVCMVRLGARHQIASLRKDEDICPNITNLLKTISKDIISCKDNMSKPREYEIHEGKSHFPLPLNKKVCSCGDWKISGTPCRHAIRAMIHTKLTLTRLLAHGILLGHINNLTLFTLIPYIIKNNGNI